MCHRGQGPLARRVPFEPLLGAARRIVGQGFSASSRLPPSPPPLSLFFRVFLSFLLSLWFCLIFLLSSPFSLAVPVWGLPPPSFFLSFLLLLSPSPLSSSPLSAAPAPTDALVAECAREPAACSGLLAGRGRLSLPTLEVRRGGWQLAPPLLSRASLRTRSHY